MQEFFAKWGDEGVVDLNKELTELIILTASRTLMGEHPPWAPLWRSAGKSVVARGSGGAATPL